MSFDLSFFSGNLGRKKAGPWKGILKLFKMNENSKYPSNGRARIFWGFLFCRHVLYFCSSARPTIPLAALWAVAARDKGCFGGTVFPLTFGGTFLRFDPDSLSPLWNKLLNSPNLDGAPFEIPKGYLDLNAPVIYWLLLFWQLWVWIINKAFLCFSSSSLVWRRVMCTPRQTQRASCGLFI